MIASQIGLNFISEYNKTHGTKYTARSFFIEVFAPLFFDHEKYMRTGGNAPLDNPKIKKGTYPNKEDRAERITKTISLIDTDPLGSSGIGYPSKDILATTSGMVTNLDLQITSERVYASWIGAGFSIGIEGGYSFFIDNPEIMMLLYEGWYNYRNEFLNKVAYKKMRGNQIDTWNGQWLSHILSKEFIKEHPFIGFDALNTTKEGVIELTTQSWLKVLFGLAFKFPNSTFTAYVFSVGQVNETIGFIPFIFPQINKPVYLYKKFFGENEYLKNSKKIEGIYGSALGFIKCCEMGSIGLKALEPKGLREYILPNKKGEIKFPDYKKTDDNQKISFNTFIIWILAMLNNESLWDKAETYAQAFIDYEVNDKKLSTSRGNEVKTLLSSTKRQKFIEGLTVIVDKDKSIMFLELAKEVDKMPADNFIYFLTLIRFRYTFLKNN
jgi:hypothetical protein